MSNKVRSNATEFLEPCACKQMCISASNFLVRNNPSFFKEKICILFCLMKAEPEQILEYAAILYFPLEGNAVIIGILSPQYTSNIFSN